MFYSVFSFFTGVCVMMSHTHFEIYFTLFEIRAYSGLLYVSLCFNTLLLYLLVYFCDRVPCTHSSGQCMILYTTCVPVCTRYPIQKYTRRYDNSRVLKQRDTYSKSGYARVSKSVKYISKCVCDDVIYTLR
jgi:hypothetical protein